jgi:hypothetical protein
MEVGEGVYLQYTTAGAGPGSTLVPGAGVVLLGKEGATADVAAAAAAAAARFAEEELAESPAEEVAGAAGAGDDETAAAEEGDGLLTAAAAAAGGAADGGVPAAAGFTSSRETFCMPDMRSIHEKKLEKAPGCLRRCDRGSKRQARRRRHAHCCTRSHDRFPRGEYPLGSSHYQLLPSRSGLRTRLSILGKPYGPLLQPHDCTSNLAAASQPMPQLKDFILRLVGQRPQGPASRT